MARFIPPIESLRPGGLPDGWEGPRQPTTDESLREYHRELKAGRGLHEDGTPRTAAVDSGGAVHYPGVRRVEECDCGLQFIDSPSLAAHRETGHADEPEIQETAPETRCAACRGPANHGALYCSPRCAAKQARG